MRLAAFANFGLAYAGASIFAGMKLLSRKACAHSIVPRIRQMSSQVPSSNHWLSRRNRWSMSRIRLACLAMYSQF